MILALHICEIGLLIAVLCALLRRGRPAKTRVPAAVAPPSTPQRSHWATMVHSAHGWMPDGKFVREGTPAWRAAHDESGRALRSPDGVLMEGKQ